MTSLLSKLVDNLAEAIHKIKCKYEHDKKNVQLNTQIVSVVLNTKMLKMV